MHIRSLVVEGYQIDPQLGRLMSGDLKHHVETGLLKLKICKTKEDGNRFHPEIFKKKKKPSGCFYFISLLDTYPAPSGGLH